MTESNFINSLKLSVYSLYDYSKYYYNKLYGKIFHVSKIKSLTENSDIYYKYIMMRFLSHISSSLCNYIDTNYDKVYIAVNKDQKKSSTIAKNIKLSELIDLIDNLQTPQMDNTNKFIMSAEICDIDTHIDIFGYIFNHCNKNDTLKDLLIANNIKINNINTARLHLEILDKKLCIMENVNASLNEYIELSLDELMNLKKLIP